MRKPLHLAGFLLAFAYTVAHSSGESPHGPAVADVAGSEGQISTLRAPRRVALLIGIADYEHFTSTGSPGSTDLDGPVNDVERMRASLRRWGFTAGEDMRVLTNHQATKAGIEAALLWVAERAASPDDIILVYFSGHGSYTRDLDGDEADPLRGGVPGDTLDEVLVPYDARSIHAPDQVIIDDDIRRWIETLKTSNVTLIVDACYSGTITRGAESAGLRRARGPVGNTGPSGTSVDGLTRPQHTLMTAAASHQLAEEILFPGEDKVFGVLTYHLTRALDGAAHDIRYDELLQQVGSMVSGSLVPQVPQLEGDRGARLFNVRGDVARRAYAVVTSSRNSSVAIDVGAVHGVRRSAIYDAYGSDEVEFASPPLAQLRVDSVHDMISHATVIGAATSVRAGARVTLSRTPVGARTLDFIPVFVPPQAASRSDLEQLDFVRVVNDSSVATHVTRSADRLHVSVRGVDLPPLSGDDQLCGLLARAFAIESFTLLHNPQPPPRLSVQVRVVPTGGHPPIDGVRVDTAYLGEFYDVYARVQAPPGSTLYLSVASTGYTDRPYVLFPWEDAMPQPFPLNSWIMIQPGIQVVEPPGIEVIKAVVNSDQYDLHAFARGLPRCVTNRSIPTSRYVGDAAAVTGWNTVDHPLLILAAR